MANIRSANRRHKRAIAAQLARRKLALAAPAEKPQPAKAAG